VPRTLKLTIAYDGSDFAGWQRQANARSVQADVEDAIARIEKTPITILGAGRTDSGVHAAAQVASVSVTCDMTPRALQRALNAILPTDVRLVAIEEQAPSFNARHDARSKTYHYWIWNGVALPPSLRRQAWHVAQALDIEAMRSGAAAVVGEHDFAAFQGTGSDIKTTVRRILVSRLGQVDVSHLVASTPGDRLLRYEVTGTGFLRHMVRNIVGTLVDVGRGRLSADDVTAILASRQRQNASATAPPHGLVLWEVEY
jgi:tRNA pseudouridine38-40 synthase